MAQINKDYYEDLTPESLKRILKELKAGRHVEPGPQNRRQATAPLGGPITLTDPALYRNETPDDTVEAREARAPTRSPSKSRKPRPR
jgi:NADH-quinone oxidoreductase subunit E